MTPPSAILSNAKDLVTSTNAHQIFRFAQQLVFTTFRMTRKGSLSIINYILSHSLKRQILRKFTGEWTIRCKYPILRGQIST